MNNRLLSAVMLCIILVTASIQTSFAQITIGGREIDVLKALLAAKDAAQAYMITDRQVAELSADAVEYMDKSNTIDHGTYDTRLRKLVKGIDEVEGIKLNFKVYKVSEINAFACGDGSVRVFSALMDLMTDDELMAIIGHEVGHIVHHDTRDAMKRAYLASAARNALGALGGTIGTLSESVLGDISQSFVSARFSQKQEYAADDYGFNFAVDNGCSPYAMSDALQRLVEASKGAKANRVAQMFSSHPDSEKRAAKMRAKAEAY